MRIKFLKWYIDLTITPVEYAEHKCLNLLMEGTYSCKYCYPPCKECGRDTAEWGVNCNRVDGCELVNKLKRLKEREKRAE